jgi:hypothetical protein
MKKLNFIGREASKRRDEFDWTQFDLADHWRMPAGKMSRAAPFPKSKTTGCGLILRSLRDRALRVHPIHYQPKMDWSRPVKAQIYSP